RPGMGQLGRREHFVFTPVEPLHSVDIRASIAARICSGSSSQF
ncbi:MAG: hypothetical protein ACI93T_004654, partial [Porticoccaceae bacterium]